MLFGIIPVKGYTIDLQYKQRTSGDLVIQQEIDQRPVTSCVDPFVFGKFSVSKIWGTMVESCTVRAEMCYFLPERYRFAGISYENQHRSGKKPGIHARTIVRSKK